MSEENQIIQNIDLDVSEEEIKKEEIEKESEERQDSLIKDIEELDTENEREKEKGSSSYTGKDITVLEGLEAVRKRPGMYIGSTGFTGLHHLVWEICDNAIDEALAGYCTRIEVTLNNDDSITVLDNGRGIPVDKVEKSGLSGVETAFTILHAGGKFGDGDGYKVSGGLHGVGASVVNALSSWVETTVYRDGSEYFVRFENGGHIVEPLKRVGDSEFRGTKVTFKPDETIFNEIHKFDYNTIRDRLRTMAYLNKAITIVLKDNRVGEEKEEVFYNEGGIKDFVTFLNSNKIPYNEKGKKDVISVPVIYAEGAEKIVLSNGKEVRIYVEVCFQYTTEYSPRIFSFCNNIQTVDGGTHEIGFKNGLLNAINEYDRNFVKSKDRAKDGSFTVDDCVEGITAVISVKHPDPQYEGQTKGKLGNSEIRPAVYQVTKKYLDRFFLENKKITEVIIHKIEQAQRARLRAKKARDDARNNNKLATLAGKLVHCSSRNPAECELFIVEGNSAGGSAKNGRNAKTQAILPLRGKILNTAKANESRIFANNEIANMIQAIGAGFGDEFDINKIKYHKIIIMTDADVDGSHIRILLLTFFFNFMRDLITNGNIYVAQPPLYCVTYQKKKYYAFSDEELEVIKKQLNLKGNYPFQRYKGLGEMDPKQLSETTMEPENRKLIKVTLNDAIEADKVFQDLMGDEVEPRREFIIKNAKFVENLDI